MPSEGKSDMERIGLFSEMEYVTIGDKYASPFARPSTFMLWAFWGGGKELLVLLMTILGIYFLETVKGEPQNRSHKASDTTATDSPPHPTSKVFRSMRGECSATVSGRGPGMHGAFLAHNGRGHGALYPGQRILKRGSYYIIFVSFNVLCCGVGTYYGTISGPCPFFSAQRKDKIAYVPPGKNLYTSPGKKGTGYGYPNITIGKPYSHSVELYDIGRITFKKMSEEHHRLLKGGAFKLNLYPREYFDWNPYHDEGPMPPPKRVPTQVPIQTAFKPSSPGKKPGGMKAGTFDTYPAHSSDPYIVKMLKPITTNKQGRIFNSASTTRSRPIRSIIAASVEKSLNVTNYKDPQVMSY